MSAELISIIVPVYNVKDFLRECVKSLLNQTYFNIEIILVDDGSTDGSDQICDEYAGEDPRIIVIHKSNGGLSDARNRGLDIARGEYIGFVDSDDWIEPQMYEKLYNKIKSGSYDIAVCSLIREYKNKSVIEPLKELIYTRDDSLSALLLGIELHDHAWSKLYHNKVFNNVRFPTGKFYEDVLTTYKTFLNANSVVVEPSPLYHYRQRGGSIIRSGFNARNFELLKAVKSIYNDDRLGKWKNELVIRILIVKINLLHDIAINGSSKDINLYWSVINEYINDLKRSRNSFKILFRFNIFRLISNFHLLPNYSIFSIIRLKKLFNKRFKNF